MYMILMEALTNLYEVRRGTVTHRDRTILLVDLIMKSDIASGVPDGHGANF